MGLWKMAKTIEPINEEAARNAKMPAEGKKTSMTSRVNPRIKSSIAHNR
jgi:hypothetical protein